MSTIADRPPHRYFHQARYQSNRGLAKGCLLTIVFCLTITAVTGIVLSLNFKNWAALGTGAILKFVIHDSGLPEVEKNNIVQLVDSLAEEYTNNRLTLQDLERISQIFTGRGPVYLLAAAYQFESDYLEPSGLSDNEKEHARLMINRLMQGLLSGIIGAATADELAANLKTIDDDGDEVMKSPEQVADDEIRDLMKRIENTVDTVGVPSGYKEMNLAIELQKSIENAIGRELKVGLN